MTEDEEADDPSSALFVVDDVPQGQTYKISWGLNPTDLHSVSVLKELQRHSFYGK
ncbi:MAG: hypothetical protein R2744_09785 [Bacteroidales bacterium]